jgi:FKBP-type peptidyl-prolyl cis-trans isomerase
VFLAAPVWAQNPGIKTTDERIGTGAEAQKGRTVEFHYTGWLFQNSKRGKKFDSSVDRFRPLRVTLGNDLIIKGLEEGIQGMKVGGKREIVIPPDLAYGVRGVDHDAVPSNATLVYEVELLSVGQ